jgi:hypothetical protein
LKLEYAEISVQDLVRSAQKDRSIAIPEFQRPFQWDQDDVAEMMRTVIRDWPSGAILLIGPGELLKRIAVTALKGAPSIEEGDKNNVQTLVLDGQQRLTSVFQALTNNSEKFVFYVDMKAVHDHDRFEDECLAWAKRDDFPEAQEAANRFWATLDVLYSELRFNEWLDQIDKELRDRMEYLFEEHLWPIRAYKFPGITLPAKLEFRSLVRIFDKLNRLGEPLDTFDLLVALMLPEGFQLRERADEAARQFADIGNTSTVKAIEITKLIALEEHIRQVDEGRKGDDLSVKGIREDDVLDLVDDDASVISREWDAAVTRYSNALRFLLTHAGGTHSNLLPQDAMIIAVAIALATDDPRDGFEADLVRWVWASYFTQAYAQGVNTRAVSDALELRVWAKDGDKKPTAIGRLETQPALVAERLRDSRAGNRLFVRGVMALIVEEGANDWLRPAKDGDQQQLASHPGAIDFHHVFPDKYLVERGLPSEAIVNFTPLKAGTNRSIGRDKPSTIYGHSRFDEDALVKHRIDGGALKADNLEEYAEKRVAALKSLIASKTGVPAIAEQA